MSSQRRSVPSHGQHCRELRNIRRPYRPWFKTRWRNHQMSFKHENKGNDTELSKHLWLLKDQKKDFSISWKILAKAKSYTNLTKRCNLCNTEKFYILYKPDMATLNKRNELLSTCRHKRKFLLKFNRIPKDKSQTYKYSFLLFSTFEFSIM